MPANYQNIQKRLQAFDFTALFTQELMWNHYATRDLEITLDGVTYILRPVARRGMAVFECLPPTDAEFPGSATRRKIDDRVSKTAREHIVIFRDHAKSVQWWQWVKREAGKSSATRSQSYYKGQSGDALVQKLLGIAFELEDEPNVLEDVARVRSAFDLEKVTKKFYEQFKKEHDAFLKFTEGIPDEKLQRWYASVMLNRLMFIYFIQKKGFLGGDDKYLANRLTESQLRGRDKFYRDLLCPLFFEGFAKREEQRTAKTKDLLGAVPYLNGGLFLKHQIELKSEHDGKPIEVPDKAFERIFGFFEQYDWHLDDRPTRTGREINPDVLGYVFEKYINQKEMGAYYTKEDITEYISKNTIIPALFDMAKKSCRMAFEGEYSIWRLLQLDPDRYIYAAVEHGIWDDTVAAVSDRRPVVASVSDRREDGDQRSQPQAAVGDRRYKPLPPEIMEGIKDVSKRTLWNKPAPPEYALPTETWREVVARRTRCEEIRNKLAAGEIRSINDLITYNLDIRRFAEEVIANCESPELLRAFYKAIRSISVLDPACGSGAFLFAALNILERLYDTCLVRMQAFVDDLDRSGEKHSPEKYSDFRRTLEEMNDKSRHPSPRYFILKSIILNNLYGVDIMEEATEICKLRLFLKLVAQVNPGEKIEPLPDIDFNIRAGNTLVGFATEDELQHVLGTKLDFENKLQDVKERAELAEKAYDRFREMQTEGSLSANTFTEARADVERRLSDLRLELNAYLSGEYGVKKKDKESIEQFVRTHQPFHWFVEFYGIMKAGGFDTIIGNPPYVEYKKIKSTYTLLPIFEPYATNLYAAFSFRSNCLKNSAGYTSLIVPVSLPSTDRMRPVRLLLSRDHTVYHTSFSTRPDKLFDEAEQRLTIYIQCPSNPPALFSGGYLKWYSEERPFLFDRIEYVSAEPMLERNDIWPKLRGKEEQAIFVRLRKLKRLGESGILGSGSKLYYKNTGLRYFNTVTLDAPRCWINGKKTSSSRETLLDVVPKYKNAVHAYLISSLFFFHYQATSNCRDLNPSDIMLAPYPGLEKELNSLSHLSADAERDYRARAKIIRMNNKKTGLVEIESLTPANSKAIIDEIDWELGASCGLADVLADYVINYDLKYRMGADGLEAYEEAAAAATD